MAITFEYEIIPDPNGLGQASTILIKNVNGTTDYDIYLNNQLVLNLNSLEDDTYSLYLSDPQDVSNFSSTIEITINSKLNYLFDDYGIIDLTKSADNFDNTFYEKEYDVIFYVFSDDTIESNLVHQFETNSFKYDMTIAIDPSNQSSNIDTTVNYLENSYEGIKDENYISNVLNGCELVSINEIKKQFIPEISVGEYTINQKSQRLYSDKSITHLFLDSKEYETSDNIYNEQITIYKRDKNFNNIPAFKYELVDNLNQETATYTKTVVDDIITIEISDYDISYLKAFDSDLFDRLNDQAKYIKAVAENKGYGNNVKRIFYTDYFPITNVKVFSIDSQDTVIEIDSNNLIINEYKGFIYLNVNTDETKQYYLFYDIVPRLDYEYEDNLIRSNFNLDLRQINNQNQTGLICINYEEKNIKKIILNQETHLDEYLIYKPECNIGVDSIILNAQVLNANDNPVEEISVRFKIKTLPNENGENGYLNDSTFIDGVTDVSNNDGISRCIYYAPYRENSLEKNILHIQNDSLIVEANSAERLDLSIFSDETFLYYIREIDNLESFDFYTNDKDYVIFYEYVNGSYRPIVPSNISQDQNNIRFEYSKAFHSEIEKDRLKLYAPKYINIVAEAIDPATGQTITSNDCFIKLKFPNYLKGSYYSSGQMNYLGYGFPPQNDDLGTGLGGANYITINPNDMYSKMSNTITINNT